MAQQSGPVERPVPDVDESNRPYWAAAKRHELVAQRCKGCGRHRKEVMPPTIVCPHCWSYEYEWVRMSGRGSIYSFTIVYQRYHPFFGTRIPYNVAYVQLDEGPIMISSIVECDNDTLKVGMPVEVTFEDMNEEVTLPHFRPRS